MTETSLESEQVGPVTVAIIGGKFEGIDNPAIDHASEFLADLVADEQVTLLVIDLSQTAFFASSFLAVLSAVHRRLKARGGKLAVCGLQPDCREVLKITRLDTIWTVCETRSEALDTFSSDSEQQS